MTPFTVEVEKIRVLEASLENAKLSKVTMQGLLAACLAFGVVSVCKKSCAKTAGYLKSSLTCSEICKFLFYFTKSRITSGMRLV